MAKFKKFITSPKGTLATFILAVALLLFSSIGGARAALTYYSDNYVSRVQMYNIGVTLEERNGKGAEWKSVSWRNYDSNNSDGSWDESRGQLLTGMLGKDEELKIGKKYAEELRVHNTGRINQYVRVSIYKYWIDKDGNKLRNLSPDLIKLNLTNIGTDWLLDKESSTHERTVLYYSKLLNQGDETSLFADSLTIDGMVATKVTQQSSANDKGLTTITTTYDYDGTQFCVEANVDAVQEHNAQDAIWSAWGRRVTVDDKVLSLK